MPPKKKTTQLLTAKRGTTSGQPNNNTLRRIKARGALSPLSLTNASGIFVINTYDIDTQMLTAWTTLATVFQRWKLHKLTVHVMPIRGSNTVGLLTACIQEDDPSSVPATGQEMLSQRVAACTNNTMPLKMVYKPVHNMWFYTGDNLTSDDRWEMPGQLHIASEGYTSAVIPALCWVEFDVSFDTLTIPDTASILKPPSRGATNNNDDGDDENVDKLRQLQTQIGVLQRLFMPSQDKLPQ